MAPSSLSDRRKALIRSRMPSEAAIERSFRHGALTRPEAIRMCHDRRIDDAERHDRGEHYGSNTGTPKRGRNAVMPYAECLSPKQRDIAGFGLAPLDQRPNDMADCHYLASLPEYHSLAAEA